MNMGNIVYFITLAECLNFTEAANRCFITQAAMSRYIAALENQLGVKLFLRDSHNMALTEAGKLYYSGMKNMVRSYSQLEQRVKNTGLCYEGALRVGIGLYEYEYMEQRIVDFLKENPKIKLEVYRSTYLEQINKLKQRDIDVLIGSEYCTKPFMSNEIKSTALFTGSNYLYMNAELWDKYKQASVSEVLKNENLITNSEDVGPYSNETIKIMLENLVGYVSERIVQTNSLQMQLKLVESGYGVALLPDFIRKVKQYDLVAMEIADYVVEKYSAIMLKNNKNNVAKEFVQFLLEHEKKEERQQNEK